MRATVLATTAALALAGSLVLAQQPAQPAQPAAAPAQQVVAQTPAPPPMPASPRGTSAIQVGGTWAAPKPGAAPRYRDGKWITVDYGRPILRGRPDIFGTGADYGKTVNAGAPVWRAGANQTTRLKTEAPLVFGGKAVPAGEYDVFVDLKEGAWTLILSTQPYQQKYDPNDKTAIWGSFGYDPKFDVVRVPMKTAAAPVSIEQFTIGFVDVTAQGGTLSLWWDKTVATVPFTVGQ
jgi:hypothetical protein